MIHWLIKRSLIAAACFYAGIACAQDSTRNLLTESFGRKYSFYSKEVISQPLLPMDQYAIVEGGYRYTSGDYKLSQDAAKQQEIFFFTEGTRKIRKFLFSGSFSYQHINQDSVPYTLRYALQDPAPYYFITPSKGNWEIGQYRLQGIVSHPLLKDKLTVGAGAVYFAGNGWRSNDPRPEYFFYDVQGTATLHYHFSPQHTLGIAAGIIRKNTNSEIEYRNRDYEQSELYDNYKTYLMYGYGFGQLISGSRFIGSKTSGWQAQGIYDGHFNQWHITAKGGYTSRSTRFSRRAELTSSSLVYGEFFEDIISADALAQYEQADKTWNIGLHYLYHTGQDKQLNILQGNNYMYTLDKLTVEPLFIKKRKDLVQYELGLQGGISNLFRADGNAGIRSNYQLVNAGITAAYYHYLPTPHRFWKGMVKLEGQLPLSPELTAAVQQTVFLKGIIYPDYYYYSASTFSATAEWVYHFPVNKTNAFFKLAGQYQQASIKQDNDFPTSNKPGNNRWYIQTSIGISL